MKDFYFSIFCLLVICFPVPIEAQESISTDAKKFCNQLRTAASSSTLRRVDSIAKNYRSHTVSEENIMNIANSISRGGDAATALAMMISMSISELAVEKDVVQRRQAINLVNNLYSKNASRRSRILRSIT